MSGLPAFLRKELREILLTARLWVLPGIMLFFALTSPIMAKLTPALLRSGAVSEEGMVILLPDPTYVDAYRSFAQNLTQLMVIAVIIAGAGLISGEVRNGTAALVLVKPVSRAAFVLAKGISQSLLIVLVACIGGIVCWGATFLVFGEAPLRGLLEGMGLWVILAVLLTAGMLLISSSVSSQPGAAGIGLAVYAAAAVLSLWEVAGRFTPAGLFDAVSGSISGQAVPVLWPALTACVAILLLLAAAVGVFRRREL